MRIAITGSTGLIGSSLVGYFHSRGNDVIRISREGDGLCLNPSILEGQDVIIHLAGANIAAKRWSSKYKRVLYDSRIDNTARLSQAISNLSKPPKLLLSGSAVGYYGNINPPLCVSEYDKMGDSFLSQLCHDWESSTKPAQSAGIRVVHMRFGVVLSEKGGVLGKVLPVFKLGLGGKIGPGTQIMSWVALKEIPLIMEHIIKTPDLSGPVNFVSPHAVSNADFTRILGQHLKKPTFLPLPSWAVKVMLGEMGQELLLSGARVLPKRLIESSYEFRYPDLETALKGINLQ